MAMGKQIFLILSLVSLPLLNLTPFWCLNSLHITLSIISLAHFLYHLFTGLQWHQQQQQQRMAMVSRPMAPPGHVGHPPPGHVGHPPPGLGIPPGSPGSPQVVFHARGPNPFVPLQVSELMALQNIWGWKTGKKVLIFLEYFMKFGI